MPTDTATFNLGDFFAPEELPIDWDFWSELKEPEDLEFTPYSHFYIPSGTAEREWPQTLELFLGFPPQRSFSPEVSALPDSVTQEMIIQGRQKLRRYLESFKPHISRMNLESSVAGYGSQTFLIEQKKELLERLSKKKKLGPLDFFDDIEKLKQELGISDFEMKLLMWSPDYGFIKDTRYTFKTYEATDEFLFWMRESPYLIVSLISQPNTSTPVWGLRKLTPQLTEEQLKQLKKPGRVITVEDKYRDDFPFDVLDDSKENCERLRRIGISSPQEYLEKINDLIYSLDYRINN